MNRKISKWKIILPILAVILLAGGGCFFYFKIYRVEPVFSEKIYEYGERVSSDIGDYLVGTEWSLGLAELDLSEVDEAHMGTYQVLVSHGRKQYTYSIVIQDTTAPEIHLLPEQVYMATNQVYRIEEVISGVTDTDVHAKARFLIDGDRLEEISYAVVGEFTVDLVADDCSGNESYEKLTIVVDTPPQITGINSFYVIPGSEPDYLAEVIATDDVDGDLTAQLQVDDSLVELSEEGEYSLRYLAKDTYGLVTVEEAKVLVASPDKIQKLIGRRQIDYRKDIIIGAPNIYDAGAADEDDMKATLSYVRPTLVQLYHETGRGYSAGSGYIMEITEDTIYICTNRHVVQKYDDWDIFFYDGTKVPGKALGYTEGYDVGVATVKTADVPAKLLDKLMTVHINRTYWEKLDEQNLALGLERVDREGGLLHVTEGELIKTKQEFNWYDKLDHTEVTVELVHGDSGSAILDGYGNLIGMAYAYSTEPTRYWCVPLDGILACYEEITGRMPYVY